jgi:hypothetical protein
MLERANEPHKQQINNLQYLLLKNYKSKHNWNSIKWEDVQFVGLKKET